MKARQTQVHVRRPTRPLRLLPPQECVSAPAIMSIEIERRSHLALRWPGADTKRALYDQDYLFPITPISHEALWHFLCRDAWCIRFVGTLAPLSAHLSLDASLSLPADRWVVVASPLRDLHWRAIHTTHFRLLALLSPTSDDGTLVLPRPHCALV